MKLRNEKSYKVKEWKKKKKTIGLSIKLNVANDWNLEKLMKENWKTISEWNLVENESRWWMLRVM